MTNEKRSYLLKLRALATRIAERADVTPPKVAYTGDDWVKGRAQVYRKVSRGPLKAIAHVRLDADLIDGHAEDCDLDVLMPESEARFALVNLLMQRTAYVRPKLPA